MFELNHSVSKAGPGLQGLAINQQACVLTLLAENPQGVNFSKLYDGYISSSAEELPRQRRGLMQRGSKYRGGVVWTCLLGFLMLPQAVVCRLCWVDHLKGSRVLCWVGEDRFLLGNDHSLHMPTLGKTAVQSYKVTLNTGNVAESTDNIP